MAFSFAYTAISEDSADLVPFYAWFGIGVFLSAACLLFASLDFFRVAELLVMLNRRDGKMVGIDPEDTGKDLSKKAFLSWDWADTDIAIERVVMTAAGGQTFSLLAVQRDAAG